MKIKKSIETIKRERIEKYIEKFNKDNKDYKATVGPNKATILLKERKLFGVSIWFYIPNRCDTISIHGQTYDNTYNHKKLKKMLELFERVNKIPITLFT